MNLTDRVAAAWAAFQGKSMPNIYGVYGTNFWQSWNGTALSMETMLKYYTSWVYACINARANDVGRAVFRLYFQRGRNSVREIEDHPVLDLLAHPNDHWTRFEIWRVTVSHLDLTGNAYWYMPRNGLGMPGEIWPLDPSKMTIVPDRNDFISHFEFQQGRDRIRFDREEICHFRYPGPSDPYYGTGPLEAARYSIDIDTEAHKYQSTFYANAAIPPFALQTDQKLNKDVVDRLRVQWDERHRGAANAGKPAVLEGGLKVAPIGVNPKDLDWLATTKSTRDDILAIFGVPASKLGLVEDVNRANADANSYTFSANVIEPILTMLDEKMTNALVRQFDERLYIQHDDTVLRDQVADAAMYASKIGSGQMTINEARQEQGYDEVEGGDVLLVPSSLTTLEKVTAEPEPVPEPLEPEAEPEEPEEPEDAQEQPEESTEETTQ